MTEQTRDLQATTRFEPGPVESHWMARWLDHHLFHAEPDPSRPPYSIVIPPPNITGKLHMGHALNDAVQDALTRYHRMLGDNACWLLGTDHAGIATQNVVEKRLRAEGRSKEDVGRDEFVKLVWAWREQYGSTIVEQLKRLGCACDYERERFTLDPQYVRAVVKVFVALLRQGLHLQGPLHRQLVPALRHGDQRPRGRLRRRGRPPLPRALRAAGRRLDHDRHHAARDHAGRHGRGREPRRRALPRRSSVAPLLLPLLGRELPIVADERVDPEFGTGALKITPAHDLTDFDIGHDHGLPTIQAIGPDGRITAEGGPYAGLDIDEARERVVADLRAAGVLEKVEDYTHSVATCDRCGTHIEPLISLQWFMRMDELKAPATDAVRDGRVRFVPERWGRVYIDWMENLRPWCISRQLWWGHQLPVWYCEAEGCSETIVAEAGAAGAAPAAAARACAARPTCSTPGSARPSGPSPPGAGPTQTADLEYFYPTNLLSTAREIIFLWVARMVMMGLEFVGDVPFREVYIHSVIQAADGRRMSKSLGTGIDPLEMIDKYGADATRFGLLLMSSSQDVRFSEEKIAMGRNFANKLWNAGRLVLLAADGAPADALRRRARRPLDHEPSGARHGGGERGAGGLRLLGGGRRALPLRLGRGLRLVPRARQGAALQRRCRDPGRGRRPRHVRARRRRAPGPPVPALRDRGDRLALRRGAAARPAPSRWPRPADAAARRRGRPGPAAGRHPGAAHLSRRSAYRRRAQVLSAAFVADDDDGAAGAPLPVVRRRLSRPGAHRAVAAGAGGRRGGDGETVVLAPGRALRGRRARPSTAAKSAPGCGPRSPSSRPRCALRGQARQHGLRRARAAGRHRQGARQARRLSGRPRRARRAPAQPLLGSGDRARRPRAGRRLAGLPALAGRVRHAPGPRARRRAARPSRPPAALLSRDPRGGHQRQVVDHALRGRAPGGERPGSGAYLSPHITGFNERVLVAGRPWRRPLWARRWSACASRPQGWRPSSARSRSSRCSPWRPSLALAEAGVEAAAIEAGLGGRLDATNVLGAPVVVLTTIGLEHTEVLGDTRELIFAEKAAVIGPGAAALFGPLEGLEAAADEVCARAGARA